MTDRVIRVVMDSSGVVRGQRAASGSIRKLEAESKGLSTGFKAAAAAATLFAGSLVVREIFQAVDAYQGLQNRLRIVTDTTAELAQIQGDLFDISQDTRTSFEATAQLYGRAAIAADELGASQAQLLRLTEISGKALAIQGGAASEASGALRQLSQSFSSGIVRAEEFNSILEGAFPIAQAAARGFGDAGISVGKLRVLVTEGKVSSQEFFQAILKGGEGIDEQFLKTQVTLSQATQTISNSFLNLVGKLNESTGAGAGLASVLVDISEGLDSMTLALTGTLEPADEISDAMKIITSTMIVAGSTISAFSESITTGIGQAVLIAVESLSALGQALVALVTGDFASLSTIFENAGKNIAFGLQDGFDSLRDEIIDDATDTIDRLTEIWDAGSRDIAEKADLAGGGGSGSDDVIDPKVVAAISDARDAVDDFLDSLIDQEAVLQRQATLGDEAAESIKRYKEDVALAAAEQEIFGELAPTDEINELREAFLRFGQDSLESQRALREEIENNAIAEAFDEQIEALELEIELLGADNEALAINAEVRALATGATAEQAAEIRELTKELLDQEDKLAQQNATITGFFEEAGASAQRLLSGVLADPMSEGLDELPFKFAQVLQQLAADALASELFKILSDLGGGGDGIGSLIGAFFGGGAAAGGQVMGGKPLIVGERGPELFTPPGSGSITPNVNINQAAQAAPSVNVFNVTDPDDLPPPSDEDVINSIQRNPDAIRRLLG